MEQFGERLKSARKIKGWSLQDLADQLSNIVTKQSLSKYEKGEMKPDSKMLLLLANTLGVTTEFFFRVPSPLPPVEFRKRKSLSVKDVESIKETVKDVLSRYLEVESFLNIEHHFKHPLQNTIIQNEQDVDAATESLLRYWDLGFDPIPNVIEMLEDKGVRVIEIDAPDAFDGLSTFVGSIPVVVLNKHYPTERKRFTALHELGHLVLNIAAAADKEKICHAFAGAMLLPDDSLPALIGHKRTNIAMGELVRIKEQYGISIQAIMMRAFHLRIIEKAVLARFFRHLAGNRKEHNLGSYPGKEKSYRFELLVFRLAAEEIVTMSKAAQLAGLKLAAFRDQFDAFEER